MRFSEGLLTRERAQGKGLHESATTIPSAWHALHLDRNALPCRFNGIPTASDHVCVVWTQAQTVARWSTSPTAIALPCRPGMLNNTRLRLRRGSVSTPPETAQQQRRQLGVSDLV